MRFCGLAVGRKATRKEAYLNWGTKKRPNVTAPPSSKEDEFFVSPNSNLADAPPTQQTLLASVPQRNRRSG